MGNFISNFETTLEFETFSTSEQCIKPHVSFTRDNQQLHFIDDLYRGHEYVEIGGVKWATMNIGANSVTDGGLYFQWGDIQGYTASQVGSGEGQKYFGWTDYKYNDGTSSPTADNMTKYNATDGKTVLTIGDDAARVNWKGSWRMPTIAEYQALIDATNFEWSSDYQESGIVGAVLTDKTDSSKKLFFPAVGNAGDGDIMFPNQACRYFTCEVGNGSTPSNLIFGRSVLLYTTGLTSSANYRSYGCSIRPVAD